ncbi:hypothetical protein GCM10023205_25450 [Yinghuangia aomiensis]|uniref:Endonuclease NucS C-terminal domain-containing protein n=1 Tax=Yinghuangia aomiensis TaxID=676205 RepID=A0ABP9H3F5_9ACTN
MPTDVATWRIDGPEPVEVTPTPLALERQLEDALAARPDILGEQLLLIGRQVPTGMGGIVDLVAVDAEGALHVIELKRDRTPREVVAQVLDYGSWAESLTHDDVLALYADHTGGVFEAAFEDRFGSSPPEVLNTTHRLTIVAAVLDDATERILGYLARGQVSINAVLFRHFEADGGQYLTRAWVREPSAAVPPARKRSRGSAEPWNGIDWYANFGHNETRAWQDAARYGFISAGGGARYSRQIRHPQVGSRVNAYVPGKGYVGVGEVTGPAVPFTQARVVVDGQTRALADLPLIGSYRHAGEDGDPDLREWVLPVSWRRTVSITEAYRPDGVFAKQHITCKLSCVFTLNLLAGFADDA